MARSVPEVGKRDKPKCLRAREQRTKWESGTSCAADGRTELNDQRGRRPHGVVSEVGDRSGALGATGDEEPTEERRNAAGRNAPNRWDLGGLSRRLCGTLGRKRRTKKATDFTSGLTFELTCGRQTAKPAGERQVQRRVGQPCDYAAGEDFTA